MKKRFVTFLRPSLLTTAVLSCAMVFYSCNEVDNFTDDPTGGEQTPEEEIVENIDPDVSMPSQEGNEAPFPESPAPTRAEISTWDGITRTAPVDADHMARLITITSASELAWLSDAVKGTGDEAPQTFEGYIITLGAHIDLAGHNWQPIGTYTKKGSRVTLLPFKGHFNGAKYTISNLRVSDEEYAGLFGCCEGVSCAIINTVIASGSVSGSKYTGGICGKLGDYTRIVHSTNSAEVSGKTLVGGITGSTSYGVIYNCHNTGKVTASAENVGGVCGLAEGTSIEKCTNRGEISAGNSNLVGGICGEALSKGSGNNRVSTMALYCNNSGNLIGKKDVGGIFGYSTYSSVIMSNNQGTVNGNENVGGICGYLYKQSALGYCNNMPTAVVTGGKYTGGICGYLRDNVMITNSGNLAAINGNEDTGGIVGRQYSYTAVRGSYNKAKVTGVKNTGGVSGYSYRSAQTASYNMAEVVGDKGVGGVTGYLGSNSQLYACYSVGNVSGSQKVGGISGDATSNAKYSGAYWAGTDQGMGTDSKKKDIRQFGPSAWPSVGTGDGQDPEWGIGTGAESGKYWGTLGSYEGSVYPRLNFEQF